jgi:hypothetical protein
MTLEGLTISRDVAGALLFMGAATTALDAYSALNSSPWTAESFGGDPAKAASCKEYVLHAAGVTMAYGIAAGAIAKSWWPIIGALIANAYMYWLYSRALSRAVSSGSKSWGDDGASVTSA